MNSKPRYSSAEQYRSSFIYRPGPQGRPLRARGQPPKPPEQLAQTLTLRMTRVARKRAEIAAIEHGFVTKTGKPKIGAWLSYASDLAARLNTSD